MTDGNFEKENANESNSVSEMTKNIASLSENAANSGSEFPETAIREELAKYGYTDEKPVTKMLLGQTRLGYDKIKEILRKG